MKLIKSSKILLLCLFLIAFIPRVYNLDETEIYPDEITWMVRGKETFYAIKQLNFKYFETSWWNIQNDTQAISLPLVLIDGPSLILFGKNQSTFNLGLFSDITAARLPIVFLNSFFIVIFYLFLRKIFSQNLSLFTAVLLALDPIFIGFGRMVINDGLLTLFSFTAICSFLFLDKLKSILLSGICLSLGFLTKPNGLLPLCSWLTFCFMSFKDKRMLFNRLFTALIVSIFLITILWPASWNKPIISIFEYNFRQTILARQQPIHQFFIGEITTDPPFYFYLFQITTRLPLLIYIGLISFPIFIFLEIKNNKNWKKNTNYPKFIAIAIYCLIFLLITSLASRKLGVRYILPLWPWIYITSCWTLFQIANLFKKRFFKFIFLICIVIINLLIIIHYYPSYQLFYNQLIGGPQNAQKYDLVGLCSGAKGSLEFIDQNFNINEPVAMIGCNKVIAPYYSSRQITTNWQTSNLVIVENAYKQLMPNDEAVKFFDEQKPIFVVKENGAILSRVYSKK